MMVERSRIPPGGLDLHVREQPYWEGVEGLWISLAPVEASFHLERKNDGILAQGAFMTTAVILCSRCSEPVSVPLSDEFVVLYRGSQESFHNEEVELSDAEVDMDVLTDDRVDLSRLLRENVLLNLPLQPLCGVDCRGLCPRCGVNRNETPCQCSAQEPDPRFRPLQHLL